MSSNPKAVLFDTNSYRYLVHGKSASDAMAAVEEMKVLEAAKNIEGYGIMIVGMELLSHLNDDPLGSNYEECLNGIIAMAHHCFDEQLQMVRVTAQPYLHLCRAYFNQVPTAIEDRAKNMAGVINDFKVDPVATLEFHHTKSTFDQIKNYINNEEVGFATQIMLMIEAGKQVILQKNPNIQKSLLRKRLMDFINNGSYEPILAMAYMQAVAMSLGINISNQELIDKAYHLNMNMPLSVGFYRWISHKIIDKTIDMQSKASRETRWNWLWDSQVAFLISDYTINNRETILVTGDNDIRNVLIEFGYQTKVFTLNEYLAYLKS